MSRDHKTMLRKSYKTLARQEELEANWTAALASIIGWVAFYYLVFFG